MTAACIEDYRKVINAADLSPGTRAFWHRLASSLDYFTLETFKSAKTMAHEFGLALRTVQKYVRRGLDAGLAKRARVNGYRGLVGILPSPAKTSPEDVFEAPYPCISTQEKERESMNSRADMNDALSAPLSTPKTPERERHWWPDNYDRKPTEDRADIDKLTWEMRRRKVDAAAGLVRYVAAYWSRAELAAALKSDGVGQAPHSRKIFAFCAALTAKAEYKAAPKPRAHMTREEQIAAGIWDHRHDRVDPGPVDVEASKALLAKLDAGLAECDRRDNAPPAPKPPPDPGFVARLVGGIPAMLALANKEDRPLTEEEMDASWSFVGQGVDDE